jgi:hypothetical protein
MWENQFSELCSLRNFHQDGVRGVAAKGRWHCVNVIQLIFVIGASSKVILVQLMGLPYIFRFVFLYMRLSYILYNLRRSDAV